MKQYSDLCSKSRKKWIIGGAILSFLVAIVIVIIVFWLTGVWGYLFHGMMAITNENFHEIREDIGIQKTVDIQLDQLDTYNNLLIYENKDCKILLQNFYTKPEDTWIYASLACYGDYDFNHTTYVTPKTCRKESVLQVGWITTGTDERPLLLVADGPAYRDYYRMDIAVLDMGVSKDIPGERVSCTFDGFTRYIYKKN